MVLGREVRQRDDVLRCCTFALLVSFLLSFAHRVGGILVRVSSRAHAVEKIKKMRGHFSFFLILQRHDSKKRESRRTGGGRTTIRRERTTVARLLPQCGRERS